MSNAVMRVFRENATACGFHRDDFVFVTPCPPIPADMAVSDSRTNAYLDQYRERFIVTLRPLAQRAGVVLYLGRWAGRQVTGKTVKITKARGRIQTVSGVPAPVLPLLSPGQVLRRPENRDIFSSDFKLAGNLREADWSFQEYTDTFGERDYRWCLDLSQEMDIDNPPPAMALDAEWTSREQIRNEKPWGEKLWYNGLRVLTIQLSWREGQAIAIPVDLAYWNDEELRGRTSAHLPYLSERMRRMLIMQLRRVLGNPSTAITGHFLKADQHALKTLNILVRRWQHDTVQLAFVVDDNMLSKTLDDCIRRWEPAIAGYADDFNDLVDKARMDEVPHDRLLPYACGDSDASLRLCKTLVREAKKDVANYRCYTKIHMPALRTFFRVERYGLRMDQESLIDLVRVAGDAERELYNDLMRQIPRRLKQRHLDNPEHKGKIPEDILSFSRHDFTRDVLFSARREGGRGLMPRVFTKTTENLPPAERVPSTSSKEHLPYFEEDTFVADLMDYQKLQKLRSTYIGAPASQKYHGVKLLKSGTKYEKRAQDVIDRILEDENFDVQYVTPPPPDEEIWPEGDEGNFRTGRVKAGRELVIDVAGHPWWRDIEDPTGFWKYLSGEGNIHPAYILHRTNTGRTASSSPNGQNIPKRGKTPRMQEFIEAYRRCFRARPGYVLIEADLSQAELRLAAWMAREPTMLRIYAMGGDIHAATATKVMGITIEEFMALPDKQRKLARFRAKAVNFGFCIAEDSLVLTNEGLVRIQDITIRHLVWDGVEWVRHCGLVYRGIRKVIEYDGLTATSEHKVWLQDGRTVSFGEAASKMENERIAVTAIGTKAVRVSFSDGPDREEGAQSEVLRSGMLYVQTEVLDSCGQLIVRQDYKLQMSASEKVSCASECCSDSWSTVRCYGTAVRTMDTQEFSELQRKRDTRRVSFTRVVYQVGLRDVAGCDVQGARFRQNKQRRELLEEQFAVGIEANESAEQNQKKVYDLLDAGPRRRFTVNGKLVSNCYGMGWRKFMSYAKTEYGIDVTEQEAQRTREAFFELYSGLSPWHDGMRAFCREHGYVRALHGALRRLPSVYSDDELTQYASERQGINAPVQRMASDLGLIGMNRFAADCPMDWENPWSETDLMHPIAFIHDATQIEAREEVAEEAAGALKWYMQTPPLLEWFSIEPPMDIVSDVSIGYNLQELEERPDVEAIRPEWARVHVVGDM